MAGGGGGEFSDVWTMAEAASRDPFQLGHFLGLLWHNTSGCLLAACLVSIAAVLLSWVYMVRSGPLAGPDRRTGTRSETDQAEHLSMLGVDGTEWQPLTSPPTAAADSASDDVTPARVDRDDAPEAAPDDAARPPPLPPAEDADSSEDCPAGGGIPDLVEMAHHLPARVKQAELRHIRQTLQGDMTEEQRRREREVERDQMAAILELMQQNSDKFGTPSLDDMQAQLKLYM